MSNASLVITVKTARSQADLTSRLLKDTTDPRGQARQLEKFFAKAAAGLESVSFTVETSANAPVQASGTLTLTYASLSSGSSTCVIGATTLTAETSPSGAVQFGIGANLAAAVNNLVACINANTTLNKYVTATGNTSTGVVTVTCNTPGVVGNFVTLTGGTGIAASASTLASGAGADETTAVNFSRGL